MNWEKIAFSGFVWVLILSSFFDPTVTFSSDLHTSHLIGRSICRKALQKQGKGSRIEALDAAMDQILSSDFMQVNASGGQQDFQAIYLGRVESLVASLNDDLSADEAQYLRAYLKGRSPKTVTLQTSTTQASASQLSDSQAQAAQISGNATSLSEPTGATATDQASHPVWVKVSGFPVISASSSVYMMKPLQVDGRSQDSKWNEAYPIQGDSGSLDALIFRNQDEFKRVDLKSLSIVALQRIFRFPGISGLILSAWTGSEENQKQAFYLISEDLNVPPVRLQGAPGRFDWVEPHLTHAFPALIHVHGSTEINPGQLFKPGYYKLTGLREGRLLWSRLEISHAFLVSNSSQETLLIQNQKILFFADPVHGKYFTFDVQGKLISSDGFKDTDPDNFSAVFLNSRYVLVTQKHGKLEPSKNGKPLKRTELGIFDLEKNRLIPISFQLQEEEYAGGIDFSSDSDDAHLRPWMSAELISYTSDLDEFVFALEMQEYKTSEESPDQQELFYEMMHMNIHLGDLDEDTEVLTIRLIPDVDSEQDLEEGLDAELDSAEEDLENKPENKPENEAEEQPIKKLVLALDEDYVFSMLHSYLPNDGRKIYLQPMRAEEKTGFYEQQMEWRPEEFRYYRDIQSWDYRPDVHWVQKLPQGEKLISLTSLRQGREREPDQYMHEIFVFSPQRKTLTLLNRVVEPAAVVVHEQRYYHPIENSSYFYLLYQNKIKLFQYSMHPIPRLEEVQFPGLNPNARILNVEVKNGSGEMNSGVEITVFASTGIFVYRSAIQKTSQLRVGQ